jgi:integrase
MLDFKHWLTGSDGPLPETAEDLDEAAGFYLEFLWESGAPKSDAANFLCGLQHVVPRSKGGLNQSWRLYKAWAQNEGVHRAVPLSVEMLLAICGKSWHRGEHALCLALLLGFHCTLRTGEMLNLRLGDIEMTGERSTAVIRLGWTKGGKRRGTTEEVVCDDGRLSEGLRGFCTGRDPREPLIDMPGAAFRKWFANLCAEFSAGRRLRFTPYSLRRGGALFHFSVTGSYGSLTQRCRWSSERTARTYLSEARLELDRQKLGSEEQAQMTKAARLLTL